MRVVWAIRRAPKIIRNGLRDLRYGKPLGGTIKTRYAHLGAFDVGNADYDDLAILFAEAEVGPDDVLVDVGCGKGRSINWFLTHHPTNPVYGIELDPEVCTDTAKRLRRYANVTILCGDATTMLPADGTLFYLFNPLDEGVMRRFRDALVALRPAGERTRIVYYNAKSLNVFEDDSRFAIRKIENPALSHRSAIVHLVQPQAK
jgi:SAM-dependent methyltransferase